MFSWRCIIKRKCLSLLADTRIHPRSGAATATSSFDFHRRALSSTTLTKSSSSQSSSSSSPLSSPSINDTADAATNSPTSSSSSSQRLSDPSAWIINPELQPYIFSTEDNTPRQSGLPFGIHFLGTGAGTPSLQRGSSATALTLGGCTYLFDVGEGVQQRLMQNVRVRPGDIAKIFITHLHGDHIFGLPGLLLSLQSIFKHRDDEQRKYRASKRQKDQPPLKAPQPRILEIYGPVGLFNYIAASISLSCTELKYVHVDVFELTGGSRRWVHPGSLADYDEFRHRGLRRRSIAPNKDGTWTLETPVEITTPEEADRYSSTPNGVYVKAAQVMHIPKLQCFGYVVQEPFSQPRTIDVQRAELAGVKPG